MFVGLFDAPRGKFLLDLSWLGQGIVFGTNEHGYDFLECTVPRTLWQAAELYVQSGLLHVEASWNSLTVWEGRVEDITLLPGSVRLQALGYWRALSDVPYTALWSSGSYADWRVMTVLDRVNTDTERFTADNNNRLYLALTKDNEYTTSTTGRIGMARPHLSDRVLVNVTFYYEFLASSDYQFRLISSEGENLGGPATVEWSLTGTGSLQSGTVTVTLAGPTPKSLFFQLNSLSTVTYTGETGVWYGRITALRVKSTASAAVYADEIAKAIAVYVNAANSGQLSAVGSLIENPGLDLVDEIYLDQMPADILTKLAGLGDIATPSRRWEVGVWDNRRLHLRARGSQTRTWYVDVNAMEIERTLEALRNSAYAVYQTVNNMPQRTAVSVDADSVVQYGLTRRTAVSAQTTSTTQAGIIRDTALQDGKTPRPRSAIKFDQLTDAVGARYPAWACQSGDTITIRNLPVGLGTAIDRVRTFVVNETRYHPATNVLEATPESPLPRIDVLLARAAEGIK